MMGQSMLLAIIFLSCIPKVAASPENNPLDMPFQVLCDFVQNQFSSHVSLATVLTVLFTMTNNPDLLALHARQQYVKVRGEVKQTNSGWMKTLAHALGNQLDSQIHTLFRHNERQNTLTKDAKVTALAMKLDLLSKLLGLHPYTDQGIFLGKSKPISGDDIASVHIICPISTECETTTCQAQALLKYTREHDIPLVDFIKGTKIYTNVPVLAGQCPKCETIYYADHECSINAEGVRMKLYLNSAAVLKIGQNTWVDRVFAGSVLNGIYNFHASSSAFMEFWNASFGSTQNLHLKKISRRQVWHAFIEESMRQIAKASGIDLELQDRLSISEVAKQAFDILGEQGQIRCADGHKCSECTHPYRAKADEIHETNNPAAVVGVDENQIVPALAESSNPRHMNVDEPEMNEQMEVEGAMVQLVVMDGIVMGPKHCKYPDCIADLANYQTGIFCAEHEALYGNRCRVQNCRNLKEPGIQTCAQHRGLWNSHVTRFGRSSLLGVQRMVRRSETENLPWMSSTPEHNVQPHDQPESAQPQRQTFTAPRFYCVETICAPCGVVIAWTKFDKSESPTNILNWLDTVYPDVSSRPDYICIDKACLLLRHAIRSGRWNAWKNTTRFIVDSYHYINHRNTDDLCRTFCNPAPLNGSAPNLVVVEQDRFGHPHYKRAFNTQACEQLNAWIGGFESILKRMSTGNFDWFLHTMLFIHTQKVITQQMKKQKSKDNRGGNGDEESEESEEDE